METELLAMRSAVESARYLLEAPGAAEARRLRDAVLNQLDDYVVPRFAQLDAPLLAVVGGSTGAGKSTLVNALVGDVVTRPGALRPTTRDPVLIHHPEDARWFEGQRILPGLPRVHGDGTAPAASPAADADAGSALRLVAHPGVRQGLGLLDAPDVDSVVDSNRHLAAQLLAAADLWIFVTTANRYADAVPWELLRDASARDVVVAIVLDRIPAGVMDEVAYDLYQMLGTEGLARAPLFLLPEQPLGPDGMLPAESVAGLRGWLDTLTFDAVTRSAVVRQTLAGATRRAAEHVLDLADALDEQAATRADLRTRVERAYTTEAVADALGDGSLLRGEVLARWQDFVGTGELFRSLEAGIGRLRDKLGAFVTGRPQPEEQVQQAIGEGLHAVLVAAADEAAERAQTALRADTAGRALLAGRDWTRATDGFEDRAATTIRDWQTFIVDLVRTEGRTRRTGARVLAFGVNGVGVVLMILAFSATGGLMGAEIAIAGGTAVVAQRLLEAIFGEEGVRRLARTAREDLLARVDRLLASERQRFLDLLVEEGADADDLRASARAVLDRVTAA
ncbi:MAG TPA: dynamin family protein [Actinotalea caeni]|uniref:dynamin family protein n=1 Tax=Actinotalea caeni TaxID=1348467 RepID=UPI002B4B5D09|nr:dynamin family protein [Actinotalea caeni]HLV56604.1 dynamin family protein [Actinotalea caeni]